MTVGKAIALEREQSKKKQRTDTKKDAKIIKSYNFTRSNKLMIGWHHNYFVFSLTAEMKFFWVTLVCLLALIMPFQNTAAEVEGRCRSGKIDIFDGIISKQTFKTGFCVQNHLLNLCSRVVNSQRL